MTKEAWVPISERLPEKDGHYLCTLHSDLGHDYTEIYGFANNLEKIDKYDFSDCEHSGWYNYDSEVGYYEVRGIVAWMPLPEPYKAESDK